jgi:hypothetical protein
MARITWTNINGFAVRMKPKAFGRMRSRTSKVPVDFPQMLQTGDLV